MIRINLVRFQVTGLRKHPYFVQLAILAHFQDAQLEELNFRLGIGQHLLGLGEQLLLVAAMSTAGDGLDHVLGAVLHLCLDAELLFQRGEQLVVRLLDRIVIVVATAGRQRRWWDF